MKHIHLRSLLGLYAILLILVLVVLLIGAGFVISSITTVDTNGNRVRSSWPQEFTDSFSEHLVFNTGAVSVSDAGIRSLDENRLWLQVLDEDGNVILARNTTAAQPEHYTPTDLLELSQGAGSTEEVVCAGTLTTSTAQRTYLIGFPLHITKVTMLLNGDGFTDGKTLVMVLLLAIAALLLLVGGVFSVWVMRHMRRISRAISQIPHRLYEPTQERGVFEDVYSSLREVNEELLKSDKELTQNEAMQEEWITNITHDLKTPLSPIKGYAELLASSEHALEQDRRVQYGQTILRNIEHAEQLINDLKLTYQLKNNMLPVNAERLDFKRFVKELVIELANHQEYSDREISFKAEEEEIAFTFDRTLLKRAIDNLLYNALLHNPDDTELRVTLQSSDRIILLIEDNGVGMTEAEKRRLFERYYRGVNTEAASEGTGLGMAIARQIVQVHGGSISVESTPGEGTRIVLEFAHQS